MVSRLRSAGGRPQQFAYFIAIPLFLLTAALVVPLADQAPIQAKELPLAGVCLALFMVAQATVLHFEVRRHSFIQTVIEIPLLLSLFYLSPVAVIPVRVLGISMWLAWQRYSAV